MANTALTAAARNGVAAATEPFCGRPYRQGFIGRGGWKNAQGKIGMKNQSETAGWRDDSPGHPQLGAGPHVNAWNIEKGVTSNLHLDY
jgi:hypothetical protein